MATEMQWTNFRDELLIDALKCGRPLVFVRKELADTTSESLTIDHVLERAKELISLGLAPRRSGRPRRTVQRETLGDTRLTRMERAMPVLVLADKACRWPYGDPGTPTFRFCEAVLDPSRRSSYCDEHHALSVYRPYVRKVPACRENPHFATLEEGV